MASTKFNSEELMWQGWLKKIRDRGAICFGPQCMCTLCLVFSILHTLNLLWNRKDVTCMALFIVPVILLAHQHLLSTMWLSELICK